LPDAHTRGYQAAEVVYHAYVTGLILALVSRRGAADAAEVVFRTFRRQQVEKFLPGLDKLGLRGLPPAVAAARYHYLSNALGGVRVEYMEESDRKAWVRYVPPRWIYEGATVCGVPSDVTRAILKAWHANNGELLGVPRLGFVCTKMTTDGDPGLEGYYLEHDRDLAPDERLRFAPGEDGPDFDPARAPRLDAATWPAGRVAKALRNFSMDYARTMLLELAAALGPAATVEVGGRAARQIGMQHYDRAAALLDVRPGGAEAFGEWLVRLGQAQGDDTTAARDGADVVVRQTTWRLMAGAGDVSDAVFQAWNELWVGALSLHDRHLRLEAIRAAGGAVAWRVRPRR
jgi:hypothetical protein